MSNEKSNKIKNACLNINKRIVVITKIDKQSIVKEHGKVKEIHNEMDSPELDIKLVRKTLHELIAKDDKEAVMEWARLYTKYFPPIVYEYSEILLKEIVNKSHIKEILNYIYYVKPTKVLAILESKKDIEKSMLGIKFNQARTNSRNIIIYSDKLSEHYVSSQECFAPVIKELTQRYTCFLAHDHKRTPSKQYQKMADCIEINTDTKEMCELTRKKLNKANACIILPITQNIKFELLATDLTLFSPHIGDPILNWRQADYRLKSNTVFCHKLQKIETKEIEEVYCPAWAPEESMYRQYPEPKEKLSIKQRRIRFGAFCRIAKVDLETLEVWSLALHRHPNADIYFSYIQTAKITEAITKSFFKELGINEERIKFLPRVSTTNYLNFMSEMDIIFGSSPEQGGISCTDALMCNVPYIVYAGNAIDHTSRFLLKAVNKEEWVALSAIEFTKAVGCELKYIEKGYRKNTSKSCKLLSDKLQSQFIDATCKGIEKIFKFRSE